MRKLNFILVFVLAAVIFSAFLPYPILSNHTNITESQAYEINNTKESEISASSATSQQILPLTFDEIDALLPVGSEFEICDIESQQIFSFVRTGGKNHADIEPSSKAEFDTLSQTMDFSWQRRPVLVKLNKTAFLPASLAAYPHGYSKTNTCFGHFCLHFLHSKTDGSNEEDFQHQKAVKQAISLAKDCLELFD